MATVPAEPSPTALAPTPAAQGLTDVFPLSLLQPDLPPGEAESYIPQTIPLAEVATALGAVRGEETRDKEEQPLPQPLPEAGRGDGSAPPLLSGEGGGGWGEAQPLPEAGRREEPSPPLPSWERGPGGEGVPRPEEVITVTAERLTAEEPPPVALPVSQPEEPAVSAPQEQPSLPVAEEIVPVAPPTIQPEPVTAQTPEMPPAPPPPVQEERPLPPLFPNLASLWQDAPEDEFPEDEEEEEDEPVLVEEEEPSEPLHPELESALADFRDWFEANLQTTDEAPEITEEETIDLESLLGSYLGLRQEVNLQTKAVRAQQEQNADLVRQLQQSLELLSRSQARSEQAEKLALDEKLRPVLTSLVELHDNLSLAGREIIRAQDGLLPLLESTLPRPGDEPLPPVPPAAPRSIWSRWILSPTAEAALRSAQDQTHEALLKLHKERVRRHEQTRVARESCRRIEEALAALVTGYKMSLERIERALKRHGLEAIPTEGRSFDPELMEVVEAVTGSGRPAGEVVEELRRGYLYNNRVFRYAQVRVAKG